jgi:Cof subfamily protein (haloacid dehalogenase superfamily)
MDGTLLNSKREISEFNKEAIKKAHDRGVHIVVSTGRLFANAEAFSDLIGVKSPVIASNGAVVRGIDKNQIIYKSYFEIDTCIRLLEVLTKHKVKQNFSTPEKGYTGDLKFKLLIEYARLRGRTIRNTKIQYVSSNKEWLKVFEKEKDNIVKCEIRCEDADKLKKIRNELEDMKEFDVVSFSHRNIELTRSGVSKGKAAERLAEYYGIKREEIIAIGDSENDLSMIKYAGTGIAMGNAMEIVKQKADCITDTNDNDGVGKAICKYVLEADGQLCEI